jgi:hypothetical protein
MVYFLAFVFWNLTFLAGYALLTHSTFAYFT